MCLAVADGKECEVIMLINGVEIPKDLVDVIESNNFVFLMVQVCLLYMSM